MTDHPAGLKWAIWTNNEQPRMRLTNSEDQVFDLDVTEAPHLAAALASYCTDNSERYFVRSEWYELDDEEDHDDR